MLRKLSLRIANLFIKVGRRMGSTLLRLEFAIDLCFFREGFKIKILRIL
jgi:hypothetical protein